MIAIAKYSYWSFVLGFFAYLLGNYLYYMKLNQMKVPRSQCHHDMVHSWILSESWYLSHRFLNMIPKMTNCSICNQLKIICDSVYVHQS